MSAEDTTQGVRVHINGRPLELHSPLSGDALYAAAHVRGEEVLYRETVGDREDELMPREAARIELRLDEHLYTAHPHKREHVIIVNARRRTVSGRKISFEQVVRLAFPNGPPTPQTVYTVAYSNGPPRNPEGTMVPGRTVRIRDDMVFDVTETSRS
jgi:hypothetical protein